MNAVKSRLPLRLTLRTLLFLMLSVISLTVIAQADDTVNTPCDPLYMDALEARAYLEAQREISQNQNLIFKPDSVLEYTCFNKFLGALGGHSQWPSDGPFSESDRWGSIAGQEEGSLNDALTSVVANTVETYLSSNYSNKYLGGRDTQDAYSGDDATDDAYSDCTEMNDVWTVAHCMDFLNQNQTDGFYDFPWYSTNDPRQLPQACTAPKTGDDGKTFQGDAITTAFNKQEQYYTLQEDNTWPDAATDYYTSDPLVTHFDLIMPNKTTVSDGTATGTKDIACADTKPIPTGVCVVRTGWSEVYQDAVCANPGCHFQADGKASSGSTPDTSGCTSATLPTGKCVDSTTTTP